MARISLSENGREGGENNKTLILNEVFICSFYKIKECKNFSSQKTAKCVQGERVFIF